MSENTMYLKDILSKVREGINFQRSEQVDGEWSNENIDASKVKPSVLPQDENDKTPSVFYNMWVQTYTTEEEFDRVKSYLDSKGLTIMTSKSSVTTARDENGAEVSNRFMIVASQS